MNIPKVLNEWMRRYIAEPEQFRREFQAILDFRQAEADGREPDYGTVGYAYMQQISAELEAGS